LDVGKREVNPGGKRLAVSQKGEGDRNGQNSIDSEKRVALGKIGGTKKYASRLPRLPTKRLKKGLKMERRLPGKKETQEISKRSAP